VHCHFLVSAKNGRVEQHLYFSSQRCRSFIRLPDGSRDGNENSQFFRDCALCERPQATQQPNHYTIEPQTEFRDAQFSATHDFAGDPLFNVGRSYVLS
jgi:hypothetical protein